LPQGSEGKDDLDYWNRFVQQFFSQKGIFRHTILMRDGEDHAQEKHYEIAYPALARYFHTHFESGVKKMQLVLDKGTTERALPNDCYVIENPKASLVYWFDGGSHVSCVSGSGWRNIIVNRPGHSLWRLASSVSSSTASRGLIFLNSRPRATRSISLGGL
jgi:hypothetical protein